MRAGVPAADDSNAQLVAVRVPFDYSRCFIDRVTRHAFDEKGVVSIVNRFL